MFSSKKVRKSQVVSKARNNEALQFCRASVFWRDEMVCYFVSNIFFTDVNFTPPLPSATLSRTK